MNTLETVQVFISYSHHDNDFVNRLVADLQARGITVWIDESGIPAGTPDWENAVREAISKADAVILIASPHSRNSRYVRDELTIAERFKHRIYPVWANGEEWIECVPLGYGRIQRIDARGSHYQSALKNLISELQRKTGTGRPAVDINSYQVGDSKIGGVDIGLLDLSYPQYAKIKTIPPVSPPTPRNKLPTSSNPTELVGKLRRQTVGFSVISLGLLIGACGFVAYFYYGNGVVFVPLLVIGSIVFIIALVYFIINLF